MSPISQRFPIPTDDDKFEEMCRDLLRLHWSRPGLEIFGKRGERQFGIDILDLGGKTPIYAAQCKLKEEHKSLPPGDIQAEVDEAKKFTPPLGKYAILTTAKVSAQAQRKIREINQLHKATGLFEVELLTWDQLCALLQEYSDVQEHFYGEITRGAAKRLETQLVSIKDGVQSLTLKSDGDEIDSQINEARDCITKRDFQLATLLLNHVQLKIGDNLTPHQKFRLLSNLGAAALGNSKPDAAAKFFLDAFSWQPDDERAKVNEALAYLLVNDLNSCHAKATVLRREYPASSRVAALWLSSAPKEVRFSALEPEINSVLRTDAEVSLALARRALIELSFEKAAEYAQSANKSAPKWSQPYLILAQISLGRVLYNQFGRQGRIDLQETSLLEAEAACTKGLDLAREDKDYSAEKMALILRADLRLMLKKMDDAVNDAEEAAKIDAQDPRVMLAIAQVRLASGRIDEGISDLRRAFRIHPDPNIAFMYGRALSKRRAEGDLDEALNVLLPVSIQEIPSEVRPAFATQTFQCIAMNNDWTGAETYLSRVSEFLDSVIIGTIRGYLAHYQDQPQEAERHALAAKSQVTINTHSDTKDYLANLFMLIGRPADALPLWQDLFDTESATFEHGKLLNCAARLQRDDLVMQTCDRLHARGVNDWHLLEFELSYFERYKIDVAIERLQTFIEENPRHLLAKLRLSMIGLRLNKPELVQSKLEQIPSVDDLPIDYIRPAIQVMKYGGNPNSAVDYAYRFLRSNFNEIQAHQALIISMMPGVSTSDIPPELEIVGPSAAVCYQEVPLGGETWVVLEDTDKPSGDFEEISLSSPLAVELRGKKVGETVAISRGTMQDRLAKIVRILPKYVRRVQDSTGEMQVRFGAASSVESIRVEQPGHEGDQPKGLDIILASVERRAAALDKARETYHNQPVSLHWYGTCFNENAYSALLNLAEEESQQIKCCFGSPEEVSEGLRALQRAKGVIVDITVLATLRLLRLEQILSTTKYHFIISERTWITLQEMISEAQIFPGPGGTMVFREGKHVMYEQTAEDKARISQRNEEFVRFVERVTERRSAPGLAAVEPEKRELLINFFGSYGAESILLASDPDYVLWTDDLIQAQTAAQEFGTRRVWTQLVLGSLADAGLLTANEYSDASANLIGMEFAATHFDSSSMLAAFKLADWSVEKSPAAQIVKMFANPTTDLQVLLKIYIEFTFRLYREPVSPETRCLISQAFLDAFANKPQAMTLLRNLRSLSSRVFGVNELGRVQFDACFDRWLAAQGKPFSI
jgi:tetratricopeptide (TPR) repeat protein